MYEVNALHSILMLRIEIYFMLKDKTMVTRFKMFKTIKVYFGVKLLNIYLIGPSSLGLQFILQFRQVSCIVDL